MEQIWQNQDVINQTATLARSYQHFTGRELLPDVADGRELARRVYEAPFVLVSHGTESDPILNYGNAMALRLWETSWEELTRTPSRLTAAAPLREERARLLAAADNPGWFPPHKVLAPGGGAFIAIDPSQAPFGTNLTLIGEVQLFSSVLLVSGCSIVSAPVPISDTLPNLGFPVRENDTFYFFRGGRYISYNWSADNPGWFPEVPRPMVGKSFFLCSAPPNRIWVRTFNVGPP